VRAGAARAQCTHCDAIAGRRAAWYFLGMEDKSAWTDVVEISRRTIRDDNEYTTCWKSDMACRARRLVCVVTMRGEANMPLDTRFTSDVA